MRDVLASVAPTNGRMPALDEIGVFPFVVACRLLVSGGPLERESLDMWRERLRHQQVAQRDEQENESGVRRSSYTQGGGSREASAAAAGRSSLSEGGDAEYTFRVQVASFAELEELTRENYEALNEVKHLLQETAAGSFSPGPELPDTEKLRELDRLVALAKALGEVAVRATILRRLSLVIATMPAA